MIGIATIITILVAAVVGSLILNRQAADELHRIHRPQIIFSRPMEITGPLMCNTEDKMASGPETTFNANGAKVWLKNTGDKDATHVFVTLTANAKLVPRYQTGDPKVDSVPQITDATCQGQLSRNLHYGSFPIYAGQGEVPFTGNGGVGSAFKPALGRGIQVELVWVWCFGYSDEYEISHATCTTYQFIPSDNAGSGNPYFICDGRPIFGTFEPSLTGHCES